MNTIECEMFIYDKDDFGKEIMCWFSVWNAKGLKEQIDSVMEHKPKCFRNACLKRILNYQNGKDWFINHENNVVSPFQKSQEAEELMELWKFSRHHQIGYYLSCYETKQKNEDDDRTELQKAIDDWFYTQLADQEDELEKGLMNEQQYITVCNNLSTGKERAEDLLSACICSAIGRQNRARVGTPDSIEEDVFRIICLPCGFN